MMSFLKTTALMLATALSVCVSGPTLAQNAPADVHWTGSSAQSNAAPTNLSQQQILSGQVGGWSQQSVDSGRSEMIQMAAVSLGSQAGMAARSQEIQHALMARATQYDSAFRFNSLMLEPGFLPPVITQGLDAYNQPNDNEARATSIIFKILRPARLTPVVPTWRTYLLGDSTPAVRPEGSVLPRTSDEKRLWDQWAVTGWNQGARLADENFEANLARLRQDFLGMVCFKMLYEQGLVTKPQLARANLGVTGGGDEMGIEDRIIRVTQKAALDANRANWNVQIPRCPR